MSRRLIPFLFVLYVVAFLDRVNVSYAQLQMSTSLGFSSAIYGFGAGLFFIGYFLFEVPSNLLLERVGARIWIARILIGWGIVSCCFMFVRTPMQFYVLRFLLGVGEAGFFPGIVLFLTYWFPESFRGRAISMFMTGIAVSGIVGGPMSGWILRDLSGACGLAGWQWLFVLEGVPAVCLGVCSLFYLQDGPHAATWLTAEEKELVARRLAEDRESRRGSTADHPILSLQAPVVCTLAVIAFCINFGMYGVNFFLPQLLKEAGIKDPLWNGVVSAVPYALACVAAVLNGQHSDATMERRWHTALPAMAAGLGLVIAAVAGPDPVGLIFGLTLAIAGTLTCVSAFWSIPPAYFAASVAAGGIALVNSLGSLGGFFGPSLVGLARDHLHNDGLSLLAGAFFCCAILTLTVLRPDHVRPSRATPRQSGSSLVEQPALTPPRSASCGNRP